MLVLLHGLGSNERDAHRIAPWVDPRLVVVSVRSPLEVFAGGYGWFPVTSTAEGPSVDEGDAVAAWRLLDRFVAEAVEAYGADPAQVYYVGFSQGGIMAVAGLLANPSRCAGAAMMSGRLLPALLRHAAPAEQLRGKPVLVVHGEHDVTLGVAYGRQARDLLATLPVDLTYREFPMGHEVTAESLLFVADWLRARLASDPSAPRP